MRDVYEVLRAKEILIDQLRREVEALRLVAPLLNDEGDNGSLADAPANGTESDAQSLRSIKRLVGARLPKKKSDRDTAMASEVDTAGPSQRIPGRLRRLA